MEWVGVAPKGTLGEVGAKYLDCIWFIRAWLDVSAIIA